VLLAGAERGALAMDHHGDCAQDPDQGCVAAAVGAFGWEDMVRHRLSRRKLSRESADTVTAPH
jgi:hypothetical protein